MFGRYVLIAGLCLAGLGLLLILGERFGLGKLPGDIIIRRKNFSFYFPIVTSIILSVIITVLLNIFLRRK